MWKICFSFGSIAVTMFCAYIATAAILGSEVKSPWYLTVLLIATIIIASVFVITGIIWILQYLKLREQKKQEAIHQSLIESLKLDYINKGKSEEEAQKLAELAAEDTQPAPPIEGEEDWLSPREAYRKSCKKKR